MASVYRPVGRKIYRIEFKDQYGIVRTVSSGMKDRRAAEGLKNMLDRDAELLRAGKEPKDPLLTGSFLGLAPAVRPKTWEEAVAAYLAELARNGSGLDSDHYRDSRTLLARIQRECHWPNLAAIRADEFTGFLGRLAEAGRAPRTQNRYHETLRAACNFWARQAWLKPSPLEDLKPIKVGEKGRRRLRRAFTLAELERLCAAGRDYHGVVYRVAAFSGFRRKELQKLRKEDCTPTGDRPRWHVDAKRTKNGLAVRLPMTPECAQALRDHWLQQPAGALLLRVPRKETFKAHLLKAGIPGQDERGRHADFHSLRYTYCWLLAQKFPIEVVSKLMRHSSLNLTMQVYLDLGLDREGEGEWVLPSLTTEEKSVPTAGPTAGEKPAA